jgi:hypothetical protein
MKDERRDAILLLNKPVTTLEFGEQVYAFMAEASNMFLVAVEQAFCSQLANSDRTTSLANNKHNS